MGRMKQAEIITELGPFEEGGQVHGVTWDGEKVWFASGPRLNAVDPASGRITRRIDVPADAGTVFDGRYLYQLAGTQIRRIDPSTGAVLATIPAPGGETCGSGLTWAEGTLWIGQYQDRCIHQIDPETGRVLRTLRSDRFVTGVTWVDGELWHGTWEGDESELRRVIWTVARCVSAWRCRLAHWCRAWRPAATGSFSAVAGRQASCAW